MNTQILQKAFRLMNQARAMAEIYEANRPICKYVHSTSRGHEAIQLATAFQLTPQDYISPYYRDESILLGLGFTPYELMLQLLAKSDDIFTGGREYYAHPNYKGGDKPTIIHQSSATGMQAIPTTGVAQGIKFWEHTDINQLKRTATGKLPIVVCSLGDASVTEGEVSEAFQFAVLKQLPIIYLVQDNEWGISVTAAEARAMNAFEFAAGFKGLHRMQVDGSDFIASHHTMAEAVEYVRSNRGPCLVHARVPLLGHHTSGVRRDFYRPADDWELHMKKDPLALLRAAMIHEGFESEVLDRWANEAREEIKQSFDKAVSAPEPDPATVDQYVFVESPIKAESGKRNGGGEKIMMVDAALFAIRELMEDHPNAILYGQDVGRRLGGVFREAATLADQFGDHRVFNTAIQEAYIVGSTVGLNAMGIKPIVEVQFGDYIYPGFNQLVTEISKSCYLTKGKFPVSMILRVPVGAYGGGGPYHSGSVETTLLSIKGIKVIYPSTAADMKGLMKAAFHDGNPVVMLEHKGLYWSKVPGTEDARSPEPSRDYVLPLGKGRIVREAKPDAVTTGDSCVVITYGMGVYWACGAADLLPGRVEVIDLRTLYPLDETLVYDRVRIHGKCLVLTEEQAGNSFAEALSGKIARNCFAHLDAPVQVIGALDLPAVPMNTALESAMLPNPKKVEEALRNLLAY